MSVVFMIASRSLVEGCWTLVGWGLAKRTVTCGKKVIEEILLIGQGILQNLLVLTLV